MKTVENVFYVYGHYRNDTGQLFYVGKGKDRRAWSRSGRNKHWRHIAEKCGYTVYIFAKNMTEKCAFDMEKADILDLNPEANYTAGGEGSNTWAKKTPEEIQMILNKRRANTDPASLASYGFMGKKHTDERNKKLSGRHKGKQFRQSTEEDINRLMYFAKKKSIKVKCVETGVIYQSIMECSRAVGLSKSWIIWNMKRNKRFIKYDTKINQNITEVT